MRLHTREFKRAYASIRAKLQYNSEYERRTETLRNMSPVTTACACACVHSYTIIYTKTHIQYCAMRVYVSCCFINCILIEVRAALKGEHARTLIFVLTN